ncbi:sugar MFS transporter [Sphingobacterium spiritivorum]|uniref:Glucose/galactose transporter WARNING n=1 Tax=Sphingobacterium spiritivorum ATCC 33861 TaxID=525373 RepID=D7VLB1_SPHSI|nr:sugar MFS transporter [Sphingobacterium spiritivorum]EFK58384.1 glucose/galactose transporter WARNING [Sphingobacterium spiritivorum ATCC 33861]QQT37130.1 sugar MFS transporter [Sphingobacterium spiritivorum]WQD33904.1 sugar MFS transporter [Sphingobacterium spiritivorum]SUJ27985.1 L-fucose permease [Sphingobacterium spiritivorum]
MEPQKTNQQSTFGPMIICCALFFILGFITWANGTLIPFLKIACNLETDLQAFFVAFASYIAYFFLALPSSWILKKIGFKNGLIVSLVILGLGSLIFIPAADSRSYGLFLTGIFVQGAAMALLQTAVNPYLSIIGPIESAAQRISIAGLFNKGAGITVPIIFGTLFLKDAHQVTEKLAATTDELVKNQILDDLLQRVHAPYIALAVIFVVFAIIIRFAHLPDVEIDKEESSELDASDTHQKQSVFQFPHLFLGSLAIFFCVAVEVMAGDIIGVYGRELKIDSFFVTYATTFTLSCMLVGYVIGIIAIPKYVTQQMALRVCTIVGIIFTLISVLTTGTTSFIFVALLGIANSLMWPAIFPLGIKGLGRFTKVGSAIMIMGIAGGAIWPLVYGYLKDHLHIDFQHAFLYAMVPAYLYILFFAVKGHKAGKA